MVLIFGFYFFSWICVFKIVYDRVTDRSRGFAFVTMGSFEEAKEAIRLFDGSVSDLMAIHLTISLLLLLDLSRRLFEHFSSETLLALLTSYLI